MADGASRLWKNVKDEGKKALSQGKSLMTGERVHDSLKREYDEVRGVPEKKEAAAEAARIAAIPEAKETQGDQDSTSLLNRKGRRSTQKVGRAKLGGRSLLG